ncbi:MAG TPA: carbon storage regulator [Gemmatimonadales bacterium]
MLNRRVGEAIVLDGDIRVVVVSVDKRGVRLGIEAPATTTILREELVKAVAAENQRARADDEALSAVSRLLQRPPDPDRPA